MAETNPPEINVDEIMVKIREEMRRRKAESQQNGTPSQIPTPAGDKPDRYFVPYHRRWRDRFLWKYGNRHANLINRIPLLQGIALRQHHRLSRGLSLEEGPPPSPGEPRGIDFIGVNWYYHDYIERTKREGIKGRIKLLILRSTGFFAWWQAQVNQAVYQEFLRLQALIETTRGAFASLQAQQHESVESFAQRQRSIEQQLNVFGQRLESENDQIKRLNQKNTDLDLFKETATRRILELQNVKVDRTAWDEVQGKLNELDRTKEDRRTVHEINLGMETLQRDKADQKSLEVLRERIQEISERMKLQKLELLDQQRSLSLLLQEAGKRLPETTGTNQKQTETMLKESDHLLDAMYVALEDRFRGPREEIRRRFEVYLPYLKDSRMGTQEAPILDLGSGRGEWLELLREHGFSARGVDKNRAMVAQCLDLNLHVVEADAVQYLTEQKANTVGAITGFHLVEHLSRASLITLFDEALRVLVPGGMVIFETPNPENLIVGACNFYLDPTHRQPIPPPTLEFLMEARGYERISVMRMHPMEQQIESRVLQTLLFGPLDYSIIAYKS